MTFTRDPLSAQFDDQAAAVISGAIRQHDRKRRNPSARGWVEVLIPTPAVLFFQREDRPDRLSRYERAFTRSLYYDGRIHRLTGGRQHPHARWSLRLDWQPVPMLPGQDRRVRVWVFRDTSGARHAEGLARQERWTENPQLRSSGLNAGGLAR